MIVHNYLLVFHEFQVLRYINNILEWLELELKLTDIIFSNMVDDNAVLMIHWFSWFNLNSSTYIWKERRIDIFTFESESFIIIVSLTSSYSDVTVLSSDKHSNIGTIFSLELFVWRWIKIHITVSFCFYSRPFRSWFIN